MWIYTRVIQKVISFTKICMGLISTKIRSEI